MTENVKGIIRKHRHVLLSEDVKKKHQINEFDISTAATLPDLDEAYTRRIHNFASVVDLYQWSSSLNYLTSIQKPMVFINAKDDPLVPEALLEPIKKHASKFRSLEWLRLDFVVMLIFLILQANTATHCTLNLPMAAIWASMKAVSSIRIPSLGWTEQQSQLLAASWFRSEPVFTKSKSINDKLVPTMWIIFKQTN